MTTEPKLLFEHKILVDLNSMHEIPSAYSIALKKFKELFELDNPNHYDIDYFNRRITLLNVTLDNDNDITANFYCEVFE